MFLEINSHSRIRHQQLFLPKNPSNEYPCYNWPIFGPILKYFMTLNKIMDMQMIFSTLFSSHIPGYPLPSILSVTIYWVSHSLQFLYKTVSLPHVQQTSLPQIVEAKENLDSALPSKQVCIHLKEHHELIQCLSQDHTFLGQPAICDWAWWVLLPVHFCPKMWLPKIHATVSAKLIKKERFLW